MTKWPFTMCACCLCLMGMPSAAAAGEAGGLFCEAESQCPEEVDAAPGTSGQGAGLFSPTSVETIHGELYRDLRCSRMWIQSEWLVPIALTAEAEDGIKSPKTERLFSKEYAKLLWTDAGYVLGAPVRWRAKEWGFAALTGVAVAGTIILIDEELQEAIQSSCLPVTNTVARLFEPFGAEYSFGVLAAFEVGGLLFHDERSRAVAHDGLAASIIAGGITWSLKLAVGRSRPLQGRGTHSFRPFGGDDSFPSGHTTQAFAVASVIAEHYESPVVDVVAYGIAALVGYSRMNTDSHYPSDILAGALIGTAVGRSLVAFNRERRQAVSLSTSEHGIGLRWVLKF